MEKIVSPMDNPKEETLVKDALTGKNMFYRFGEWKEISDDEVDLIKHNI